MKYIKSIARAFKMNVDACLKIMALILSLLVLTYLPYVAIVWVIKTVCIMLTAITVGVPIYIGIKDAHRNQRR